MRRVWKTRRPGSGTTTDTRTERMDRDLETAVPEGRGSVTVGGSARSLRRERTLILALLLILAAALPLSGVGMFSFPVALALL